MTTVQGLTEKNWAGNYTYRAREIAKPGSLGELRELVVGRDRIRALGSRHSFNALADTTGTLVSITGLGGIEIDAVARTVTVGGGVTYGALAAELSHAGFALHNMASLPHISVAGAVATGTHGSGDANGNLATAVVGLSCLDAQGDIHTLSKVGNEDFAGYVVGLGALGIVTELTLAIEPHYEISQTVYARPRWDRVLTDFDAMTSAAYSVSMFTDWSGEHLGQVWFKSRAGKQGKLRSLPGLAGARKAISDVHPLPGGTTENCTEQRGMLGSWNDRLPHFRADFTPSNGAEIQSEYLIPREHALPSMAALRELGEVISPLLQVSEIRTVAADDLWMSPCFQRETVALHFTWIRDHQAVDAVLPLVEAALAPFAARPHWGKHFLTDPGYLGSLYPRLGQFKALALRMDPEGKFGNDFLATHLFA